VIAYCSRLMASRLHLLARACAWKISDIILAKWGFWSIFYSVIVYCRIQVLSYKIFGRHICFAICGHAASIKSAIDVQTFLSSKTLSQSCQVSRFTRESPGFRADLQVSRLVLKISRILTKIQLAKILSVLSKENPYMFVKWEIKKAKSEKIRSLLFK
jgi:hypothetical protein